MKLYIIESTIILILLIKNYFAKSSIITKDDYLIKFSDKFKHNLETEDNLTKFKNILIKNLNTRKNNHFSQNIFGMDLLQTREREKIKYQLRNIQSKENLIKKHMEISPNNANFLEKSNISIKNLITSKNLNISSINKKAIPEKLITFQFQNSSIHKKIPFSKNNLNPSINNPSEKNKTFSLETISPIKNLHFQRLPEIRSLKTPNHIYNLNSSQKNHTFPNSNIQQPEIFKNNTLSSSRKKTNTNLEIFDWSFGDINSSKRITKFFINLDSKCNIFINDTVYYDRDDFTSNFIDHLILHNNFDSIEPRSIYSHDVTINYFIYNKKLNMFTVNFENEKHKNYSIVYEYVANNLIKLKSKKDLYSNTEKNVNEFLWKFYNENTNSKNLNLEVEFHFTINKSFINENVEFNNKMFMYKTTNDDKETTVFKWNGTLMPYEVKVFESVFPMVFENCQTITVNFTMILIGAFFVIFIVLILYLLFSSIAKDIN